jgi:hypothetical protein
VIERCGGDMTANPNGERRACADVFARIAMATVLLVTAIAALAITSVMHGHERAAARDRVQQRTAPSRPAMSSPQLQGLGAVGTFAFGHLEFDWDPTAPDGVPGFDTWPPGGR